MHPVLKRTLSGLGVGALVIALFVWCPLRVLLPVIVALGVLLQLEFYQLVRAYEPLRVPGLALGALWLLGAGLFGFGRAGLAALAGAFPFFLVFGGFALCLAVLFQPRFARPVSSVAATLAGFFYVPFLLGFFLLVAQLGAAGFWGGDHWPRAGLFTLFALVAVTKFSDTGGFAFGLAFGRHKMCPAISPKKSWEGLLGSMLFSAGVAALFLFIAHRAGWGAHVPLWGALTYPVACALGALVALVATASDLIESRLKREVGVKDSATFMPAGMGGFLDMFDSVLFVPALAYPFLLASM